MNREILSSTDLLHTGGLANNIKLSIKRFGFLKSVALYMMLKDEERRFIREGRSESDRSFRKFMIRRFKQIQENVDSPHSPFQHVLIAKHLFDLDVEGPIVECGAFKGSSTAQLSIIAEKTGRRLYVYDSFEGLPEPILPGENVLSIHNSHLTYTFKKGEYAGSLEDVKANVSRYGCIDVCEFIPGLFNTTLPKLNINPAAIVIDVDLISSARDCFKYLWPKLKKNGLFFTHEASLDSYISGIMDKDWWQEELRQNPPLVLGAGSGLSPLPPGLALIIRS